MMRRLVASPLVLAVMRRFIWISAKLRPYVFRILLVLVLDALIDLFRMWLKPNGPPQILVEWDKFNKDVQLDEVDDAEMEGEAIHTVTTNPLYIMQEVGVGDNVRMEPVLQCAPLGQCLDCGGELMANIGQLNSHACRTCNKVTKKRGSVRTRYNRGSFNLVRAAQRQFPDRLNSPNQSLARQQIYVYMLREAQRLDWTVAAQVNLPALAAIAMLPCKYDVEARLIARSELAQRMQQCYTEADVVKPPSRWNAFIRWVLTTLQFRV